ncbi:BTB/POZ domain-containing protein [Iris pallida]|uniref:BTB/POZ domain-containing protein n=1 Tax=Iris pallida TaxID=29817 RepID=A0AAX6DS96_IRIPA|nr:BTB/POZ domain-containing protein [Iris pallida]
MVGFDQETTPTPAIKKKQLLSSAMQRTSEWVFSQEIPSDIAVQIGGVTFSLHKFPLVSKCGLVRQLLSEAHDSRSTLIEIPDIPGGAEAFELIARFCYGINFEISIENLAMLRCASEYLAMTDDYSTGNLVSRTEAYLEEVALMSLSGAVTVLHKSEGLLPMAEKVKLVSRCIDAIAYIACNDSQFSPKPKTDNSQENTSFLLGQQPRAIVNWCAEELTVLRIDTFQRVLMAMKARGFKQYALGPVIMLYAQKSLRGLDIFGSGGKQIEPKQEHEKRVVLETIVSLLPREKNAMSVSFLSVLLRAAVYLETTVACRLDLEKRMGLQLDQAVLDDLLIPSFSSSGETTFDVDTVQRILMNYLDNEVDGGRLDDDYVSMSPNDIEEVGKLMESYLAEIASDQNLTISRFISLAELIPEQAKVTEDGMYRGIDIYLKAHPSLNDTERIKVCSLMNCQKLSREACAHAAQNDRLPVQIVVQVLYYEQQRIQNSTNGSFRGGDSPVLSHKDGSCGIVNHDQPDELSRSRKENVDSSKPDEPSRSNDSVKPADQLSRLRRENDNLKLEVGRLRMQVKELEKSSGNSAPPTPSPSGSGKPPLPKKSLMNSVTKKLSRLYPFVQSDGARPFSGKAKTKPPKDRRHSIS